MLFVCRKHPGRPIKANNEHDGKLAMGTAETNESQSLCFMHVQIWLLLSSSLNASSQSIKAIPPLAMQHVQVATFACFIANQGLP